MTPRPVIVDTDGGVDDAAALWYLLTTPSVDIVAITVVHGNVATEIAVANVCRVLHEAGRPDIPVAVGVNDPVGPAPVLNAPVGIHGLDGMGDTNRPPAPFGPVGTPALELLSALTNARPGEIALVTLGPLSNIGALIIAEPTWASTVDEIIIMGGTVNRCGNALPAAEANIAHDPVAAQIVGGAAWRKPPVLVGLDVTHVATMTDAEFALLAERRTPAAVSLDEPLQFYRPMGSTFCEPGECPCHDLLAAMVAVHPDIVTCRTLPLGVDTGGGVAWGATVADRRVPFFERRGPGSAQASAPGMSPWRIALDVDVALFRAEVRRLFGG